jgi:hypothetical protein
MMAEDPKSTDAGPSPETKEFSETETRKSTEILPSVSVAPEDAPPSGDDPVDASQQSTTDKTGGE